MTCIKNYINGYSHPYKNAIILTHIKWPCTCEPKGINGFFLRLNLRLLLTLFESKSHIINIFHLKTNKQKLETKNPVNGSQTRKKDLSPKRRYLPLAITTFKFVETVMMCHFLLSQLNFYHHKRHILSGYSSKRIESISNKYRFIGECLLIAIKLRHWRVAIPSERKCLNSLNFQSFHHKKHLNCILFSRTPTTNLYNS